MDRRKDSDMRIEVEVAKSLRAKWGVQIDAKSLREAGVKIERKGTSLKVKAPRRLKCVDVTTMPYGGFPTDVQAQLMSLMILAPGISIITERIFESRFMHVSELMRLGADIGIEGPSAIVKGGRPLSGAPVMASDLRASAALSSCAREASRSVTAALELVRSSERKEQFCSQMTFPPPKNGRVCIASRSFATALRASPLLPAAPSIIS